MSRTKAFLSGASLTYLYQGCMIVVGLWLTPFYLHRLGAHDYGIWLVGMQVLIFLLLCDLGVLAVAPRDIAAAHGVELAQGDSEPLRQAVGRILKSVLVQTALVAAVALGLYFFRPVAASELRGPIALVLAVFVLTFPLRCSTAILQGLQDLKYLGAIRVWLWSVAVVTIVLLLIAGAGFYALACGWCVQEAGSCFVATYRFRRIRPDLCSRGVWRGVGPFCWRWLTRGLWVSVGQVSISAVAGSDVLIVARVFGPATVVIYSCTAKLVQVLQQQPAVLASTALPGLSQMWTSEGQRRIHKAATCLTEGMILVAGAIVCVVFPLNREFVRLWIGSRYFGGMVLTTLFLANFLARMVDYTLALALFAFGHERLFAVRALLDAVVSVALAAILVRPFGMAGIITGYLCGALLVTIPLDLHRFAREFEISIPQALLPYVPYLWRIAAVGATAYFALRHIVIPNLFWLAVAGAAVGLLYLAITIPYVRKSELGGYIRALAPDVRTIRRWVLRQPMPATADANANTGPDMQDPEALAVGTIEEDRR